MMKNNICFSNINCLQIHEVKLILKEFAKIMILEVCVDSVESALVAERGGAARLELCSALELGGLTPSIGLFLEVKRIVNIPIFCMLRPRSGDFCYSSSEISCMKYNLEQFVKYGANGFVFGILTEDCHIDETSCKQLIESLSESCHSCTFHRAFDFISPQISKTIKIEKIKALGFQRILTTGGGNDVGSSLLELEELLTISEGIGIIILPGGGVDRCNAKILKNLGFHEIHSSCSIYKSESEYGSLFNEMRPKGNRKIVGIDKVKQLILL